MASSRRGKGGAARHAFGGHVAYHPLDGLRRALGVERVWAMRVGQRQQFEQLRIVVQHLFEVRPFDRHLQATVLGFLLASSYDSARCRLAFAWMLVPPSATAPSFSTLISRATGSTWANSVSIELKCAFSTGYDQVHADH
jgi:hypothetical protein